MILLLEDNPKISAIINKGLFPLSLLNWVYPKPVMNIEWDYSYYQPWSDNEWLVDEMIAMREEVLMAQNEDITMQ